MRAYQFVALFTIAVLPFLLFGDEASWRRTVGDAIAIAVALGALSLPWVRLARQSRPTRRTTAPRA